MLATRAVAYLNTDIAVRGISKTTKNNNINISIIKLPAVKLYRDVFVQSKWGTSIETSDA